MSGTITLEIATPDRVVLKDTTDSLIVPGLEGYLGIWSNHAPLVAALRIGILKYKQAGGGFRPLAVSGGFLELAGNRAVVLADAAELPEEINVERARKARERAERRLQAQTADTDLARAELALRRAANRLRVVGS
ncbi:MAG: F0F1 ATP synthase subunit epsilon [Firmicutes bacterium]|nr:F0F1 ATP synthase subunit epsilon [Bacillota bacterium]